MELLTSAFPVFTQTMWLALTWIFSYELLKIINEVLDS